MFCIQYNSNLEIFLSDFIKIVRFIYICIFSNEFDFNGCGCRLAPLKSKFCPACER